MKCRMSNKNALVRRAGRADLPTLIKRVKCPLCPNSVLAEEMRGSLSGTLLCPECWIDYGNLRFEGDAALLKEIRSTIVLPPDAWKPAAEPKLALSWKGAGQPQ
jgi:hypothetical protein